MTTTPAQAFAEPDAPTPRAPVLQIAGTPSCDWLCSVAVRTVAEAAAARGLAFTAAWSPAGELALLFPAVPAGRVVLSSSQDARTVFVRLQATRGAVLAPELLALARACRDEAARYARVQTYPPPVAAPALINTPALAPNTPGATANTPALAGSVRHVNQGVPELGWNDPGLRERRALIDRAVAQTSGRWEANHYPSGAALTRTSYEGMTREQVRDGARVVLEAGRVKLSRSPLGEEPIHPSYTALADALRALVGAQEAA